MSKSRFVLIGTVLIALYTFFSISNVSAGNQRHRPNPTSTPTPTPQQCEPTPTKRIRPTVTPTVTPTLTLTITPEVTPTTTPTITPTITPEVTPTQEPTPTPTNEPKQDNQPNQPSSPTHSSTDTPVCTDSTPIGGIDNPHLYRKGSQIIAKWWPSPEKAPKIHLYYFQNQNPDNKHAIPDTANDGEEWINSLGSLDWTVCFQPANGCNAGEMVCIVDGDTDGWTLFR